MQLRKEGLKKFRLVLDSNSDLGDTTSKLTKRGSYAFPSHELTKAPYIGRNSGIDCKAI